MQITLFTANCTGVKTNCIYPNKVVAESKAEMVEAIKRDHVCAKYTNNYRSNDNFEEAVGIFMDNDNDHSENPADWLTAEKLSELLCDVDHVIAPSRHNMLPKDNKAARPRQHIYFPTSVFTDRKKYEELKAAIQRMYPFFDDNAKDAARFFFGSACSEDELIWNEGWMTIDEAVDEEALVPNSDEDEDFGAPASSGPILEGSRNNTMSHFAGRILKKLGVCDKAKEAYKERARKCEPPLSEEELETIWNSAVKFYEKVASQEGYIAPDQYNDEFAIGDLKPEDYSDIGEAKVIARSCRMRLRYTSATDFITFHSDRWYEDKQKSLGTVEDFLDTQLADAEDAVKQAEDALISLGVDEESVKGRDKKLADLVPADKLGLLFALIGADTYKKFVMKYRNYKNIVNAQNAAKPMLAIDVSELDFDPELLNTPEGTFDLTKGLDGVHPHDPDDLITKITACGPGDKGSKLWEDALNTFFCNDQELIDYVQEIVGMAAVGKVYAEHMIIAYGGGANGKSTFWNTIARVLGNYSGKLSAEALTMNCKRNVKPEMAELKGKRLIIASELEEGTRLNTGMVKQLCSVDPIEAEKKFKDPFHFDPSHTLVLYTNHLPKVSANDDGTWRRLIVIPFNAKIVGNADIKNYGDYLYENAGPAILAWVINGAKKAFDKGFKFERPKVVVDAVEAYREENDWLGQFLEEHCDVGAEYEEKSGELYQSYRSACLLTGEYIRSTTDFYGSLEKIGFTKRRNKNGRVVMGLRLKEGQDFLD